ncbi:MAG TPA: heme-binding protein [Caulobacteraceae bacterium]|nr:heme-binding protein [Caulobacteraceae bacterium]
MTLKTRMAMLAALLASPVSVAHAQSLITEKVLPLQIEIAAAQGAIDACAAGGFHVSAVVVDAYGNAKVMLIGDGTIFTTADSARRKAYTAIMMHRATSAIQAQLAANPGSPPPGDGNPEMLALAGGLPIKAGDQFVGGIGVGGAASLQDEKCAQAGIDKVQAVLH